MRATITLILFASGLAVLRAQTFEVATIKVPQHVFGQPYDINLGTIQHDTVTLTNVSLADCIRFAYGLSSDYQLSGPDWITSKDVRYDIVAKTAPDTSRERALQMMQRLLAERFNLASCGIGRSSGVQMSLTSKSDERGPSVFTAVEEQLGLRLASRKGPRDVLVVDRADEVPIEN